MQRYTFSRIPIRNSYTTLEYEKRRAVIMTIRLFSSGAGGSRTPVQTRRKNAFYKFSLRLVVGAGMVRDTPGRRLSSNVSPQPRSAALAIYPFMILRSGRWAEKLPGEHPRLRTLSARRNPQRLRCECIRSFAIYLASRVNF